MANCRKVICVETGKIYDSVKDAADDYGVTKPTIFKSCTKKTTCTKRTAASGLSFRYVEERQEKTANKFTNEEVQFMVKNKIHFDEETVESWEFFEERMKRIFEK